MASLDTLLNPESTQERDFRMQHVQNGSTSPPLANTMAYERAAAESNYYAQTDIIMRPHEPHPDCPDTLACLPDTNGRPQHTLPVILRCAILGSPKKRLTIREIYAAMEKKYPYYKTAGPAWKQSVRHHLSLNRLFERQPRPATDPGFGSYWTVNLEAPPGTKRPRKRGRAQKDTPLQPPPIPEAAPFQPAPIRLEEAPKRYEGPPIAILRPVDASSFKTSAVRNSPTEDDDEDDEMGYMPWGDGGPIVMSDEDYDSEEPHQPYNYRPPASASSSSSVPTPTYTHSSHTNNHNNHTHGPSRHASRNGLHGVFSSSASSSYTHVPTSQEVLLVQLRQEIEILKRQSADQEHLCLRLSNQLTRAETEAARAKQALKMAESRLEDEARRRVEAERAADEEARARRAAEDQLRTLQIRSGIPSPR
ncbi:hypothetical protein BDW22DRAFT_1350477 [Trametopsis cervina]|nr:hypothetical protein BDW22DRAFT_1350477 [Trametopsis cervina]